MEEERLVYKERKPTRNFSVWKRPCDRCQGDMPYVANWIDVDVYRKRPKDKWEKKTRELYDFNVLRSRKTYTIKQDYVRTDTLCVCNKCVTVKK